MVNGQVHFKEEKLLTMPCFCIKADMIYSTARLLLLKGTL